MKPPLHFCMACLVTGIALAQQTPPSPAKPANFEPDPAVVATTLANVKPLAPLLPKGEEFVDPSGQPRRFWGVNFSSFFPEHDLADKTVEHLTSLGVNLVREGYFRESRDWCASDCFSLLAWQGNSRALNPKA